MRECVATVVRMVIETTSGMQHIPQDVDRAQPEARVLSHTRSPLPQTCGRIRRRGERIMLCVKTGTYQVMATSVDALAFGHQRVSAVFYRGRVPAYRPRKYTNLHARLHVAPGHRIQIGRLRDAIVQARCPGLELKRCKQPRSPVSHILYIRCAQSGGAKKARQVTIIAEAHSVMLIGICDLRFADYIGAVRRLLAASGAMDGPRAAVDHREAFWPAVGARDAPGVAAVQAYIAAHVVGE